MTLEPGEQTGTMNRLNLKRTLACLLIFFGGMGLATTLLSLLDPVGSRLAPDGNSLVEPMGLQGGLLSLGIYLLFLVAGIWLAVRSRPDEPT